MTSTIALQLIDGVQVVVPDSLDLITPYVLIEQQDWFEDEIKFLRHLLKPGQKVIDIGANYGVYTLSMAQTVGTTGQVWAFEPASSTAALLAESIMVNGFQQVVLEKSALSSEGGTAQLSLNQNSELNALVHDQSLSRDQETVTLVTLDECLERYDWQNIDFLKIDAEGEEAKILQGGTRFLAEHSPLVQYEIKAGSALHLELVKNFADLGYHSYQLVPGLNMLIPFDEAAADGYLLNLFCCKPDRATLLAEQGYLLMSVTDLPTVDHTAPHYHWQQAIGQLPYGTQFTELWEKTMAEGHSPELPAALSYYTVSQDASRSTAERFGALAESFRLLQHLCAQQPSALRLASLARVAGDYGARTLAVNALHQASSSVLQQNWVDLSEPFLVPGKRFDAIETGDAVGSWFLAAVLEEMERLRAFSSFYTGAGAMQCLEMIRDLGFGSSEMERRYALVQKRFAARPLVTAA